MIMEIYTENLDSEDDISADITDNSVNSAML